MPKIKPIVDHLSYSAVRSYMTSPSKFWKEYVMREGFKPSLAMAAGSAWHSGLESYFRGDKEYVKVGMNKMLDQHDELFAELEGDDAEKMLVEFPKETQKLVSNLEKYPDEDRQWDHGHHIEQKVSMPSPVKDGLPITGVIDLVTKDGNPVDHKYVSRFTSEGTEKYAVQAWFYYHLTHNLTGKYPQHMIISEYKKSKNRDKTPQLRSVLFEYEQKTIDLLDAWYQAVSKQIIGQKHFLPNPFQFFGGEDWREYLTQGYDL